jgi:hypothetical protein
MFNIFQVFKKIERLTDSYSLLVLQVLTYGELNHIAVGPKTFTTVMFFIA